MKQLLSIAILGFALVACAARQPQIVVVTVPVVITATPAPTATLTPTIEIAITECGYSKLVGRPMMAGTVTNNTIESVKGVMAAVALIKNGQVVRTDGVYLVSPANSDLYLGVLDGLWYEHKSDGLAPGELYAWNIEYLFVDLTQPFECEISITSTW